MEAKKTHGRQKIEMKLIEDKEIRSISLSKRRRGIYKKVCELATLCGVEISVVIFSTNGKPYSFGHPSVEFVINKFLNRNQPKNDGTNPVLNAERQAAINNLIEQHNSIQNQLDLQKEQENALKQTTKGKGINRDWWNSPIDKLNVEELEQLNGSIDELYSKLHSKIMERCLGATSSFTPPK